MRKGLSAPDSLMSLSQRTLKEGDVTAVDFQQSVSIESKGEDGPATGQRGRVTLPSEVDARTIEWEDELGFEVAARETIRNNATVVRM